MENKRNEEQSNMNEDRRKRIQTYKRLLVGIFFAVTLIPIVSSIIMLRQVSVLEQQIRKLSGELESEWLTVESSGEAVMAVPNENLIGTGTVEGNSSVPGDVQSSYDDMEQDINLYDNGRFAGFDTEEKTNRVYLTFDDGPTIYTGQILDILEANDVKATFFVIAKEDERFLPYYKEIVERGHTLGMHSYTHEYSKIYASLEAFEQDVSSLSDFLYKQTGQKPEIYRFPGGSSHTVGAVSTEECIAYLNEQGIVYYDWNALNGDAVSQELSPEQLVNNIMNGVRKNNTSIVLMHDTQARHTTVESLQLLIDTLKSEGYELLPIDENTPLIQHVQYNTGFGEAID